VPLPEDGAPGTEHELVRYLNDLHRDLTLKNCRETLHEALVLRDEVMEQFIRGDLNLAGRAAAERLLRHIVAKIHDLASDLRRPLEELPRLKNELDDLYFCNFSIFQSIPIRGPWISCSP